MNKKTELILLISIVTVALMVRFYRLDLNIPNIYSDEASHYSSLAKIYSSFQPRLIAVTYTWVFGLNPLGVRFGSALYGTLSCLAIYYFALRFSKKRAIALVAALLMALLPWNYMLSRIGHPQVLLVVIFVLLHCSIFIDAKQIRDYILSFIPLSLAFVLYPSMVILAPLPAVLVLAYMYRQMSNKQRRIGAMILVPIIVVISIYSVYRFKLFDPNARGLELAIWLDVNTPYEIDKYRALSWNSTPSLFSFYLLPEQLSNKLVYNRVMANASVFTKNYLSFFSPEWLFLKGDAILRHSTGQVGAFYLFLIPFMLYGAFKFWGNSNKRAKLTFLIWILVSPVPAAVTKDGSGYLLRVVTLLPFLTYFCALGIIDSLKLFKKTWQIPYGIVIILIGLYSAYYFFYGYFHVYPALSARSFEYGFKELSDFQVIHNQASMLVIWDGYYHNKDFRFWQKTPFEKFSLFEMKRLEYGDSIFWQTYDNLYFSAPKSTADIQVFLKENPVNYIVLPDRYFVRYPTEIEKFLRPVEVIRYPDQTTALSIYTFRERNGQ